MVYIGNIGHHIRDLRVSRGMTQAQLGAIMGWGVDAVALMESSAVPDLRSDAIRHLAETFHAYPRTFLYGSDEEFFAKALNLGSGNADVVGAFLATPIASKLAGCELGAGTFEAIAGIAKLNAEGVGRAATLIGDLVKIEAYRRGI